GLHLRGASRMILAQRMSQPGWRQHDAGQIRMSGEVDTEHVPALTFVPVGIGPQITDGGDGKVWQQQRYLEANVAVLAERHQVVGHRKIRGRLPLTVYSYPLVDRRQVEQHL